MNDPMYTIRCGNPGCGKVIEGSFALYNTERNEAYCSQSCSRKMNSPGSELTLVEDIRKIRVGMAQGASSSV
jgi:hypothetical protein